MTETGSAPLAPEGHAEDLRRCHGALVSRLAEMGASCLAAIRDVSVTYLTGYCLRFMWEAAVGHADRRGVAAPRR